jgi:hypothetical protein
MTTIHRVCAGFLTMGVLAAPFSVAHAQGAPPDPYATPGSSGLQAGGLAPIGSGSQTPQTSSYDPGAASTEQSMKKAEEQDSGRGLEFVWLNAEAGYQVLGLQTFKKNNLVDAGIVKSTQNGLLFGAGAGVRLIFLTLGGRFRLGTFDNWQLWTLAAEAGLHLPLGRVEPYFTAGFGYASLGAFDVNKSTLDLKGAGVDIHGWTARGGFGLDVYVTNVVTIGANLTGDVLFMTRPGVDPKKLASTASSGGANVNTQEQAVDAANNVYAADGSSIGAAMTATAVVGLHF